MKFLIAKTAASTGNLLAELVQKEVAEEKIKPKHCLICYGIGATDRDIPVLNEHCSDLNKLQQAEALRALGNQALEVFKPNQLEGNSWPGGIFLGRATQHTRGRDIRLILEPWQVRPAVQAGTTFFTKYVPSTREFRTWVYRNRHLGTYEKILTRPEEYKTIGRNYHNGFTFQRVESDTVPDPLKVVARQAIKLLNLDFGAVDLLQDTGGQYVVLEVNSAPGVADERRQVIQGLAHRIVRWMANGCPTRGE